MEAGRRSKVRNGLGPHPRVAVEHWEGERGYRVPAEGERGPDPIQGLLSPGKRSSQKL